MSTASMQQSSVKVFEKMPMFSLMEQGAAGCRSEDVIALLGIEPPDRVLVIGPKFCDHLIALAHCGCRSATGIDPAFSQIHIDQADVVWISGAAKIDDRLAAAILRMDGVRLVAIDAAGPDMPKELHPFLQQLRRKGLAQQAHFRIAGRVLVTSHRAEWLKWIA